jgi:hypothetical protein
LLQVKFFPGRKLEYEAKHCEKHRSEQNFLTAVEFSMEDPYGKAVALLDLKSGFFKVKSCQPSFFFFLFIKNCLKYGIFFIFILKIE